MTRAAARAAARASSSADKVHLSSTCANPPLPPVSRRVHLGSSSSANPTSGRSGCRGLRRYRRYKKRNRHETAKSARNRRRLSVPTDDECGDRKLDEWGTISKTEARRIVHG